MQIPVLSPLIDSPLTSFLFATFTNLQLLYHLLRAVRRPRRHRHRNRNRGLRVSSWTVDEAALSGLCAWAAARHLCGLLLFGAGGRAGVASLAALGVCRGVGWVVARWRRRRRALEREREREERERKEREEKEREEKEREERRRAPPRWVVLRDGTRVRFDMAPRYE